MKQVTLHLVGSFSDWPEPLSTDVLIAYAERMRASQADLKVVGARLAVGSDPAVYRAEIDCDFVSAAAAWPASSINEWLVDRLHGLPDRGHIWVGVVDR